MGLDKLHRRLLGKLVRRNLEDSALLFVSLMMMPSPAFQDVATRVGWKPCLKNALDDGFYYHKFIQAPRVLKAAEHGGVISGEGSQMAL